jgi:hypothetical protein
VRALSFIALSAIGCIATALPAGASDEVEFGPKLGGQPSVERWEIGVELVAENGPCRGIASTIALPVDWPEQQVRIVDEDLSPFIVDVDYRMVDTVKQMVIDLPALQPGQSARAVLTVEITRRDQSPPDDPTGLLKLSVKKLPKDVRGYLGPSPGIESQSGKFKSLAKKLLADAPEQSDWQKVETLFDWVRTNVEQTEKQSRPGALQALKDKQSNHEGLCYLFIALCRASEVPARTVWLPKYCYPEFYLTDAEGNGYWFPCQVAGTRQFGGINERRPIWQKGDNFKTPERPREAVRYLQPELTGKGGNPTVTFIRQSAAK